MQPAYGSGSVNGGHRGGHGSRNGVPEERDREGRDRGIGGHGRKAVEAGRGSGCGCRLEDVAEVGGCERRGSGSITGSAALAGTIVDARERRSPGLSTRASTSGSPVGDPQRQLEVGSPTGRRMSTSTCMWPSDRGAHLSTLPVRSLRGRSPHLQPLRPWESVLPLLLADLPPGVGPRGRPALPAEPRRGHEPRPTPGAIPRLPETK